jgi:hypothetical protein
MYVGRIQNPFHEIGNVLLFRFPWPGYVEDFDLVVEPMIKNK